MQRTCFGVVRARSWVHGGRHEITIRTGNDMPSSPISDESLTPFQELLARSGGLCEYCGTDLLDTFERFMAGDKDHVLTRGVSDDLALSCRACNLAKSKHTPWDGPSPPDSIQDRIAELGPWVHERKLRSPNYTIYLNHLKRFRPDALFEMRANTATPPPNLSDGGTGSELRFPQCGDVVRLCPNSSRRHPSTLHVAVLIENDDDGILTGEIKSTAWPSALMKGETVSFRQEHVFSLHGNETP